MYGFRPPPNNIKLDSLIFHIIFKGASAGVLESEGYEMDEYPANFHKMYEIEVAEGKLMEIEFTDFDLEEPYHCTIYDNYRCTFDFVMVHDGEDADGDGVGDDILLPKTCNNKVPTPFTSNSHKVQVHFKTDRYIQKKGWRLVYTEV